MTTERHNDFAFQTGTWRVAHRKLRARLAGCQDWFEFGGTCKAWEILGGIGNIEDNWLDDPSGPYAAAAVRKFDPQSGRWSIWWIDPREADLDPPVHGQFDNGVGTFLGKAVFEGRPIDVRFIWSGISGDSAHWEQAFSEDGGASWETNWTMKFDRVA